MVACSRSTQSQERARTSPPAHAGVETDERRQPQVAACHHRQEFLGLRLGDDGDLLLPSSRELDAAGRVPGEQVPLHRLLQGQAQEADTVPH